MSPKVPDDTPSGVASTPQPNSQEETRLGRWLARRAHAFSRTLYAVCRTPRRRVASAALLVAIALLLATTRLSISGRWYGLYLLQAESGRPLELKDDLRLGDGPRLLGGVSFSVLRALPGSGQPAGPRLELEWDEADGGGVITNVLEDGSLLQTVFGRYVEYVGDREATPRGLFVGGAIADVAAGQRQNQSGMAFRDAQGWHHVWCNVNEVLAVEPGHRLVFPGQWKLVGSRVLARAADRIVLQSEHELVVGADHLRMERYAYFKAGRRFFRLGINLTNLGDEPVVIHYGYGDEPWVGEFGSAEGNVGWTSRGVVPVVGGVDPVAESWGGILDLKSGIANYVGWGETRPDDIYFGNHSGTPRAAEVGAPLTSNEIFIGLEWRNRTIAPGDDFSVRLTLGLAAAGSRGEPIAPPEAFNPR